MFIAIEGTDASGKSSLCDEISNILAEHGEVLRFHKGRPEEETRLWALREYAIAHELSSFSSQNVVSDRWHWGEVTYAPLKRPHTCVEDSFGLLGIAGWRWVELFMASRGMIQFWLYQPLDVIKARLAYRGDDFVSVEDLEQIIELYAKAAEATCSVLLASPASDSFAEIPDLAQTIIKIAKEKAAEVEKIAAFPEYIGKPAPKVLLIGDQRNGTELTILPFMPINSNSGEYLMTSLTESSWRDVGIVNSEDVSGERMLDLWKTLGTPPIAALGRSAEKRIVDSGIPSSNVYTLPHPQYVKRFHYHDKYEYGAAIERVILGTIQQGDEWLLQ
jgi:thymidylate kinase